MEFLSQIDGTRTRPNSVLKAHSVSGLHRLCSLELFLIYATKSLVRVVYEIHINHSKKWPEAALGHASDPPGGRQLENRTVRFMKSFRRAKIASAAAGFIGESFVCACE